MNSENHQIGTCEQLLAGYSTNNNPDCLRNQAAGEATPPQTQGDHTTPRFFTNQFFCSLQKQDFPWRLTVHEAKPSDAASRDCDWMGGIIRISLAA